MTGSALGVILVGLGVLWLLSVPLTAWYARNAVRVPQGARGRDEAREAEENSKRVNEGIAASLRRTTWLGLILLVVGVVVTAVTA